MTSKRSGLAKFFSILRSVLIYTFALCIIIAAILFAASKSPNKSLFGYRYYTVLTPSMTPTYKVGDLVFVKLSNAKDIKVGDVITFNPSSDTGAYLTHRVTEKFDDYEGTGVTCYRTKGDANDSEDGFLIDQARVIGRVTFKIPKLGYVIRFIQLKWYFVLPLVILFIVFLKLLDIYSNSDEEESEETEDNSSKESHEKASEEAAEETKEAGKEEANEEATEETKEVAEEEAKEEAHGE